MKDNLGSDYFLLAHVDLEKVRTHHGSDLGIEFMNEIDAWSKMEFKFRGTSRRNTKYVRNDLKPLVYGIRLVVST